MIKFFILYDKVIYLMNKSNKTRVGNLIPSYRFDEHPIKQELVIFFKYCVHGQSHRLGTFNNIYYSRFVLNCYIYF